VWTATRLKEGRSSGADAARAVCNGARSAARPAYACLAVNPRSMCFLQYTGVPHLLLPARHPSLSPEPRPSSSSVAAASASACAHSGTSAFAHGYGLRAPSPELRRAVRRGGTVTQARCAFQHSAALRRGRMRRHVSRAARAHQLGFCGAQLLREARDRVALLDQLVLLGVQHARKLRQGPVLIWLAGRRIGALFMRLRRSLCPARMQSAVARALRQDCWSLHTSVRASGAVWGWFRAAFGGS
jgi:hypothetical protein